MKTAIVTGAAGFIGYHISQRLLDEGWRVVGVDLLSDYYDVSLKKKRQAMLATSPNFKVYNEKIETPGLMMSIFEDHKPDAVIHLAAQAGVRYSIENPRSYLEANIIGTFEILEAARAFPPAHMLLASTSSAYGANTKMPYAETDKADHQVSFYAATKKSTENMAHSYAHLFGLPITMFRFFTVYGPWGRPDMAPMKFAKRILAGDPIDVYNQGQMKRDFTYIDDLIDALSELIAQAPVKPSGEAEVKKGDSLSPVAPFRVLNIGNASPEPLMDFIAALEDAAGVKANMNMMDMQAGDVVATWANTDLLKSLLEVTPSTTMRQGVNKFMVWYREYYSL
ncbi:NAD-dependent epimerase/dehydratase family protein [Loktanella sp. F6476L]|uniref:NAD-dependent epimerase/dehydratase family protein n=1 Tax=Loktanella sp. F6476L TaxID=2926405 RepID=UPI001FF6E3B7|nr:NAD-dependent epimerase/dehydratase family protein [Loktanella sp. F6476L]MCK0122427.1 NAD-dependent epimerase/dehydratase family protein [Loktanella sp. F6476L]